MEELISSVKRSAYITVGHVTPYGLLEYVNTCYSLIYRYPIPYEEGVRMEVLWSRQGKEVHNESASNGALSKEAEAEARKRTLSDATIPSMEILRDSFFRTS